MKYLVAADTDIGIVKATNQDSICVKTAETSMGPAAMMCICDGMGGLAKGELASAFTVKVFSYWFENEFPKLIDNGLNDLGILQNVFNDLIRKTNNKIGEYGQQIHLSIGTTLVIMVILGEKFIICNVGDSRIYCINQNVTIMTTDQTYVAREISRGNMTLEQAKVDPKRNVLLQCIGASKNVVPQYIFGNLIQNSVYMACSDGFRHEITEQEILNEFSYERLSDEDSMKQAIRRLIELNKKRTERDNISAALLMCK